MDNELCVIIEIRAFMYVAQHERSFGLTLKSRGISRGTLAYRNPEACPDLTEPAAPKVASSQRRDAPSAAGDARAPARRQQYQKLGKGAVVSFPLASAREAPARACAQAGGA